MKRLKGTNKVTSNVIAGICNDQDVANNFQDIYKDLYNSVDDKDLNIVVNKVNKLVINQCNSDKCSSSHCHKITKDLVQKAIVNLKSGKDDETHYLSSNHFIYASELTIEKLSIILDLMIRYGIANEHIKNQ